MKERPIIFSAPMVRAILDGRKTQTRRAVKPQPDFLGSMVDAGTPFKTIDAGLHAQIYCPYGQPGDRLWVKEMHAPQPDCWGAWANWSDGDRKVPKPIIHYRADGGDPWIEKWRPSIHMPRWASRIDLEIIGVRVERLQDISDADAIAEGIYKDPDDEIPFNGPYYPEPTDSQGYWTARDAYCELWESLNGAGSWAENPWVWVIEFRRTGP